MAIKYPVTTVRWQMEASNGFDEYWNAVNNLFRNNGAGILKNKPKVIIIPTPNEKKENVFKENVFL